MVRCASCDVKAGTGTASGIMWVSNPMPPDEATIRRVLEAADAGALDAAVGSWLDARLRAAGRAAGHGRRRRRAVAMGSAAQDPASTSRFGPVGYFCGWIWTAGCGPAPAGGICRPATGSLAGSAPRWSAARPPTARRWSSSCPGRGGRCEPRRPPSPPGPAPAWPRLLDTDFDHGALLLEQIRPGTHLPGNHDPRAIEVAASLLGALHRAPLPAFPFPALQQAFTQMERRARRDAAYEQQARNGPERGRPGLQRLPLARAAALRLCHSPPRTVLLHGDFLAKNLLSDGTGYLAIDPIPSIGDPCADIGFFAAGHPPAATILRKAGAIAELMGAWIRNARNAGPLAGDVLRVFCRITRSGQ